MKVRWVQKGSGQESLKGLFLETLKDLPVTKKKKKNTKRLKVAFSCFSKCFRKPRLHFNEVSPVIAVTEKEIR